MAVRSLRHNLGFLNAFGEKPKPKSDSRLGIS